MRFRILTAILFSSITIGWSQETKVSTTSQLATPNPESYANSITSEELKELLYVYASDEFEGRLTGTKGQKMAVEFLKKHYKEQNIPSPLGNGDYFQEVPLVKQKVAKASLDINDKTFDIFDDFVVVNVSENTKFDLSEVVYVGHGIDSENYSDYKDIDVKGKFVLIKEGEPKDEQGNYLSSGTPEATKWTNGRQALSSKRDAAKARGAAGIFMVNENMLTRYAPYLKRQANSNSEGRLRLKENNDQTIVALINNEIAEALYPDYINNDKAKRIKANIDFNIDDNAKTIMSENVVALIEGSEYPEEIIVISAHLDHEGVKDGKVYNGADDDGSGSVALLEIAEAFQEAVKDGNRPKRSILFLHVTGEEKGLLGSKHYTDNDPIFPLENTVANLNIDMIGRTDPKRKSDNRNYIYLIGSDKLSTELHEVSEAVNSKYTQIELDYTYNDENDPNRFYYRSDHYNFAKNNVPVIFYFNGTHDDYHRPTDTPDKIEYDLLENRTKLVFHTAWELANRPERIVVDKTFN